MDHLTSSVIRQAIEEPELTMLAAIIYASVQYHANESTEDLSDAVQRLLSVIRPGNKDVENAQVLWTMSFTSHGTQHQFDVEWQHSGLWILATSPFSPAVSDEILVAVRKVWRDVTDAQMEQSDFLRFEDREEEGEDS
jgi:hypothetical protein